MIYLSIYFTRTDEREFSFTVSTVDKWNRLPTKLDERSGKSKVLDAMTRRYLQGKTKKFNEIRNMILQARATKTRYI